MAFTRIDLTTRINNLYPPLLRKTVLLSLVGTLNARLVGAADKVAQRLVEDGYDLRELEERDVDNLLQAVDFQGNTTRAQLVLIQRLRSEWAAMLELASDDDTLGSIEGTIEMMVGVQKTRPVAAGAAALLASVGVELSAEDIAAARRARLAADQTRADERAQRRGFIEWSLEHCFRDAEDCNESDHFLALSTEVQEQLVNKYCAALNKAVSTATQNVLMGSMNPNALGLSDIIVLRNEAAEVLAECYPKAAPKVTQPDAPGPNARRVKKVRPIDRLREHLEKTA